MPNTRFSFPQIAAATLLLALTLLAAGVPGAEAAWRFDTDRFLKSKHGKYTCATCHADVVQAEQHPVPANVNRSLKSFFDQQECYTCHQELPEQFAAGKHGRKTGINAEDYENCLTCHNPHYVGAYRTDARKAREELTAADASCMSCHQSVAADAPDATQRNREFCFQCHATDGASAGPESPLMDLVGYQSTPHSHLDCLTCHKNADVYPHNKQEYGDCTSCHARHKESEIHDAHINVSCESCHLTDVTPVRDPETKMVLWRSDTKGGEVSNLHLMNGAEDPGCQRCHVSGNTVGAANMELPPKSVICMACHTSTFTAGDSISILSLLGFFGGLVIFLGVALTGSVGGLTDAAVWKKVFLSLGQALKALLTPRKGAAVAKAMFQDVLLQRRLYKRSTTRWLIHSLIFLPFVFRFFWGVITLLLTNILPEWSVTWDMVNKNDPLTAFTFDLTGLMMLVGITLAWLRGREADKTRVEGLPNQDTLALGLIGGIVVVGFVLEGLRIGMTGTPPGAGWAFIGYALSTPLSILPQEAIYGPLWYLHALLTGAFLVYLPFSKLMHIIMAPVALAMNAIDEQDRH